MSIKQELIKTIEFHPERALHIILVIVKELLRLESNTSQKPRPVFGSGKGLMWIADDFDEPLEDMKEYME